MIRAVCPACGAHDLRVDEIKVRGNRYAFECPTCWRTVSRLAHDGVLDLLATAGARVVPDVPAEVHERPDGPLFTHDDLLGFAALLAAPGWFDALAGTVELD